jgi:hypothetical protein
MKVTHLGIVILSLGFFLVTLGGCQTDSPGVTYTLGNYTAMVNASPDKVTNAAKKSLEQMKLTDISGAGTKIDGKVTAMTAQAEHVTINIEQAGENVSKVSIRVGATGDEAVSKQILDKIKDNLHWF